MTSISRKIEIDGRNERLAEACLRIIYRREDEHKFRLDAAATGHEIARAITDWVKSYKGSNEEQFAYVINLKSEAKQSLIPLSDLDWVSKNDRACYWVWLRIKKGGFYAHPSPPFERPRLESPQERPTYVSDYNDLKLTSSASNSQERFEQIIKFIDRVDQHIEWQRDFNDKLRGMWNDIYDLHNTKKLFSWLDPKDEEQCVWAWEYISSYVSEHESRSFHLYRDIKPSGAHELYCSIFAMFDSWDASRDAKELFKMKFNNAWNQKRHRRNRTKVVACNFEIKKSIKEKLDHLSEVTGTARNKLIESLIEEKFSSLQRDDDNNGKAG